MQLVVQMAMTLLAAVAIAACGGSSSTAPAAPTYTPTAAVSTTSVTFSGAVTNIVMGVRVGGAIVTIGSASATTNTDGTYSVAVTASGQPSVSVAASGYHTRESVVSMTGATTI